MPAGLFGKLPAKRDFIGANAPRRFLDVWEPWLQAGLATSKQMLRQSWTAAYNSAPIWRFWLGASLCGEATIGAFMPSVDGVGRSFPLTIFAGESGDLLPPPELDPNDDWCEAAEAILLSALEPDAALEAVAGRVAAMPKPALEPRTRSVVGLHELPGAVLARDIDRQISAAFVAARRFGHRDAYAGQSFWWTIGGVGFRPVALSQVGLPPAARFADILTGAFTDARASASEDTR
ncbi:MAG: type VI secretion system-associated protein TagF [Hyphomicrobiales bacterium]|nr:type VI secretion system-associated protein TagF [Hyphomicrobiales bacterium]